MRQSTKSDPSCRREPEKLSTLRFEAVKNSSREGIAGLNIDYMLASRCYTAGYRSEQLATAHVTYWLSRMAG